MSAYASPVPGVVQSVPEVRASRFVPKLQQHSNRCIGGSIHRTLAEANDHVFGSTEKQNRREKQQVSTSLSRRGVLLLAVTSSPMLQYSFLHNFHVGFADASPSNIESLEQLLPSPVDGVTNTLPNPQSADRGILGSVKRLLDSEEETKSGRRLPKAYLQSARSVINTLRDSLSGTEDGEDGQGARRGATELEFRRKAEGAKEAIRGFIGGWRGSQLATTEPTYQQIESAIKEIGTFYSKNGPRAVLPSELKRTVVQILEAAEREL